MEGREFREAKKTVEDFIKLALNEQSIDQLAMLTVWASEAEDEVSYFTKWLELGDAPDSFIREFEIDIFDLLDDVMSEKRRLADEAAEEEYQRFLDLHR